LRDAWDVRCGTARANYVLWCGTVTPETADKSANALQRPSPMLPRSGDTFTPRHCRPSRALRSRSFVSFGCYDDQNWTKDRAGARERGSAGARERGSAGARERFSIAVPPAWCLTADGPGRRAWRWSGLGWWVVGGPGGGAGGRAQVVRGVIFLLKAIKQSVSGCRSSREVVHLGPRLRWFEGEFDEKI
jgi:hypothetical protein